MLPGSLPSPAEIAREVFGKSGRTKDPPLGLTRIIDCPVTIWSSATTTL